MAKWKCAGHAETSYKILGRMAGYAEEEINAAINSEDQDKFYERMMEKLK